MIAIHRFLREHEQAASLVHAELDATIGWRWTRNLDLTIGYHAIVMTDALQVSGAIDRDLAVNAADNPTGQQRPNAVLRYDTYYIHGIHFGLQCVY